MYIPRNTRKAISILLLFFAAALPAQAQKAKDSLVKVMASDVCAGLKAKDSAGVIGTDLEMEIGLAFMPAISKHADALKELYGDDYMAEENMARISEQIAMVLVANCPVFLKIMEKSEAGSKNAPAVEKKALEATLLKVVPGEFTHLLVKDAAGKQVKLWWLEPFEGAEALGERTVTWLNKKVTVQYYEKDVYNAAGRRYNTIKVIAGISK